MNVSSSWSFLWKIVQTCRNRVYQLTHHPEREQRCDRNDTQLLVSEAEAESVPEAPGGAGEPQALWTQQVILRFPEAPLMVGIPIKVFLVLPEFYSLFTMTCFTKVSSTVLQNHFMKYLNFK